MGGCQKSRDGDRHGCSFGRAVEILGGGLLREIPPRQRKRPASPTSRKHVCVGVRDSAGLFIARRIRYMLDLVDAASLSVVICTVTGSWPRFRAFHCFLGLGRLYIPPSANPMD